MSTRPESYAVTSPLGVRISGERFPDPSGSWIAVTKIDAPAATHVTLEAEGDDRATLVIGDVKLSIFGAGGHDGGGALDITLDEIAGIAPS